MSACVTLFFEDSGPVTWHKPRVCAPCNIGTLRRIRTNTKCCFPQTITINGTPVPDFVAPQAEWYRGNLDDLNDAPFWPTLDVDPMEDSPEVPVRYVNGELQLRIKDLASNGFGVPWGHTRIYSNRLSHSHDFGNGTNWLVHEWPQLVSTKTDPSSLVNEDESGKPTGCTLVMLRGTRNTLWFDEYAVDKKTEWRSRFGAKHILKHDSKSQRIQIIAPNGHLWEFHDFTCARNLQCAPRGSFARHEDPAGNQLKARYECCRLQEVWRSGDSGDGTVVTESFLYDYFTTGANKGRLHTVLLKRSGGIKHVDDSCASASACREAEKQGGKPSPRSTNQCSLEKETHVRRVEYLYYENEPHGNPGDLKMAATQIFHEGRWKNLGVHYYRYRKQPLDTYCQGLLTFVVDPEGFRRLVNANVGPAERPPILGHLDKDLDTIANSSLKDLATQYTDIRADSALAEFAEFHVRYDLQRRVSSVVMNGGRREHSFEYVERKRATLTAYNAVLTVTAETRADKSQRVVLTNLVGQTIVSLMRDQASSIRKFSAASTEIPTGKNSSVEYRIYGEHATLLRLFEPSSINHGIPITLNSEARPGYFAGKGMVREYSHSPANSRSSYLSRESVRKGSATQTMIVKQEFIRPQSTTIFQTGKRFDVDVWTMVPRKANRLRSFYYFKRGENQHVMSNLRQWGMGSEADSLRETHYAYQLDGRARVRRRAIIEPELSLENGKMDLSGQAMWAMGTMRDAVWSGTQPVIEEGPSLDIVAEGFDMYGNLIERKDVRGARHTFQHYVERGALKSRTVLADGRKRDWFYNADDLGRTTAVLGPAHDAITNSPATPMVRFDVNGRPLVIPDLINIAAASATTVRPVTWTLHKDLEGELWTATGHADQQGGNAKLFGEIEYSKFDRAGRATDEISLTSKMTSISCLSSATCSQSQWTSWQHNNHDRKTARGTGKQMTSTRVYHQIPQVNGYAGRKGINYEETTITADITSRATETVSPGGTITKTTHDKFGMLLTTEVGTNTGNLKLVEQRNYDEFDHDANPDRDPNQGSKGLLTRVARHDGQNYRVTIFGYDWRDRASKIVDPDGKSAEFEFTQAGIVKATTRSEKKSGVVHRRQSHVDVRGRTYKVEEHGVYPEGDELGRAGTLTGRTLVETFRHNGAGDIIEHRPAGSRPSVEYPKGLPTDQNVYEKSDLAYYFEYDQLGQQIEAKAGFAEERFGKGKVSSVSDVVHSVTTKFDLAGNPVLVTTHQYSDALKGFRADQVASWYDPLGRQRYIADYGARDETKLLQQPPATVPLWSQMLGDVRITTLVPDDCGTGHQGAVSSVIDNVGRVNQMFFDHAGRVIKRIENQWGNGQVAGLRSNQSMDRNRTTHYAHTPSGNIKEARLINPATGDQVTRFLYNNERESSSPDHDVLKDSDVYNDQLLSAVVYPDQSRVDFRYNQQGEIKAVRYQNGTIHFFKHDQLGRLVEDRVERFSQSVTLDKTIDTITYQYNDRGLISHVLSHSFERTKKFARINFQTGKSKWFDRMASNINEKRFLEFMAACDSVVTRQYDEFDQLVAESQRRVLEHRANGVPRQASSEILYKYASCNKRWNRSTAMVYPGIYEFPVGGVAIQNFSYERGSADDHLSRPSGIRLETKNPFQSEELAAYEYWGLDNPYRVAYEKPGVTTDLERSRRKGYSQRPFASLDDFDRVGRLSWSSKKETVVDNTYRYDRSGSLAHQADCLAPATQRDEVHGRDLLDRLISLRRGKGDDLGLTVPPKSKDGTSGLQFSQDWTLDYAGNWRVFSQDDDGDGDQELRQLRVHTQADDILLLEPTSASLDPTARKVRQYLFKGTGLGKAKGAPWHHPQYDRGGNLIRIPQPNKPDEGYKCVYDAWNRMAVVGVPLKNRGIRKVARFRYDGLGRVASKLTYDDKDLLTEERHFDYSSGGRLIQEQVFDTDFKKQGNFRIDRQYVWGTRGPNDLILRLRDSNGDGKLDERRYALQDDSGDVVALTDEKGEVQERFRYRPSGEVEFYDAGYKQQDESACKWELLLGAQRRDTTTGLFIGNDGAYHPLLGRPLQQEVRLAADEETFQIDYQKALAAADPESFNSLQYYVPPPPGPVEPTLWDRIKSVAITGGVVALNVIAWANPIGFITGPIVTTATFAIGAYNSYQSRHAQLTSAYGSDVTFRDVASFVAADMTGVSSGWSIATGEDIATGQRLSTADRIETVAHFAVGIAVGRATPPVARASGRAVARARPVRSRASFASAPGLAETGVSLTGVPIRGTGVAELSRAQRIAAWAQSFPVRIRLLRGDARVRSGVAVLDEGTILLSSKLIIRMSRLTAGTNREVALFRHSSGNWYLRLGRRDGRAVNFADLLRADRLDTIAAHTHPSGHVYLSVDDVLLLNRLGADRHAVISGGGDVVRWFDVPRVENVTPHYFQY